ncbi:hypothetical protein ACOSP6_07245 [Tenacibaculum sp. MEBiC06402]|uniref:hypothetical protein n=1 Tax=unclassified Tenacibaculum TaxID=2635139 RepID=UPI003B9A9FE5
MITHKSAIWRYISNLFISIDQLGNVIAGGFADNTISARIGYYNHHYFSDRSLVPIYWKVLEQIIDFAFKPVDGPNHCHEAFHTDPSEVFDSKVTNFLVVLASIIIIIPSCVIIGILFYSLTAVKLVKQKTIDRNRNINNRFTGCNKYLQSIKYEIIEHPNEIDNENLKIQIEKVKKQLETIC